MPITNGARSEACGVTSLTTAGFVMSVIDNGRHL